MAFVVGFGMTEVLWPDQLQFQSQRLWTSSKDLVRGNTDWYIVHRLSHRDKQSKPCSRNRETVLSGCQKLGRETVAELVAANDNQTLARKPLETVTLRRSPPEIRNAACLPQSDISGSTPEADEETLFSFHSQHLSSSRVGQSKCWTNVKITQRKPAYRAQQSSAAGRELKALQKSNELWNWKLIEADCKTRHQSKHCFSKRTVEDLKEDTKAGNSLELSATNLKNDCLLNRSNIKEVVVPLWRVVETKRRYVIEQTEDLGDEVFKARHQKPALDEKRRKRWDEQRQRDLQHLQRLQSRKEESGTLATAPNMTSIRVIEAEPVIAFGHFIASIPPREFSLPRALLRQSKLNEITRKCGSSKYRRK